MRMNTISVLALIFMCAGGVFGAQVAHAIEGGRKVGADEPIARVTVAVNVHFAGVPGLPPPNPPDHSLNPCTGVVVDDDLVLTAAHCVKQNSSFQIIFSTNAGDPQAVVRDVTAYDIPLEFQYGNPKPSQRSDIAMLYFQGGLPAGYGKAKLWLDTSTLKAGTVVSAAGYGSCRDAAHCALTVLEGTRARARRLHAHRGPGAGIDGRLSHDRGRRGSSYIVSGSDIQVFGVDNGSWSNLIEVYGTIGPHADWMQKASVRLRTTNVSQGPGWGPGGRLSLNSRR